MAAATAPTTTRAFGPPSDVHTQLLDFFRARGAPALPREPSAWASLDDPATPSQDIDDSANGMNSRRRGVGALGRPADAVAAAGRGPGVFSQTHVFHPCVRWWSMYST